MFVEIVWKGCLLKEMRKKNEEYRKYIFSGLWTTRNAKVWLYNHFMSYGELILSFFIEVLFWEHWKKFKDEGGTCLRKYSLSSIACLILICWLDNLAQSFECDWQSGRVAHSLKSLKCRLHMYAATLADLCMTDDWYPSLIARSGPGLRLRAARSETTAPRPHCNVSRSCYCVHWHTHNQTLPYEYYFLRTV